jgi:hypothetical protein
MLGMLMNAKKKIVLYILGGVAVAIVLAAIVFTLTFDLNFYRLRIEVAASEATGLEVRINGKLGLSFFPLGLSVKDIHIANKGFEIISIDTLKLGAELMPLIKKQFKVTSCELFKPAINIVKDAAGKYDFEGTEHKSAERVPGLAFTLNELKPSKGVLVYLDKKTDEKTEFKDFNVAMKSLSIGDTSSNIVKNLSFIGSFDCKEVLQRDFRIENLKTTAKAVKGIYNFEPLTIGVLVYFDKKAGEKTELKEINLAIKGHSVMDTSGVIIRNIAFTGNLDCKAIQKKNVNIGNVKSPIKVEKGVIYLAPLAMGIFGSKGEG